MPVSSPPYFLKREKECKEGIKSDRKQTFHAYCDYVINLKEERGLKHSTIVRYKELTSRIYPHIGHIKLKDLRVDHFNDLYTYLFKKEKNKYSNKNLSPKTVLEHHRLISTVLEQAVKESLIPFNPASRREILGLKWDKVDLDNNQIYICNNVLYSPDIGIYESTPKTDTSKRFVSLPSETIQLLKKYKTWQLTERLRLGAYYKDNNFVFSQDNGNPMHPDSVTDYLNKFSKKYNLPHINPHAFRHIL